MIDDHIARQRRIAEVIEPLPGSVPYTNRRPMTVALKNDGRALLDFLGALHPHTPVDYWSAAIAAGDLSIDGRSATKDAIVRAGNLIVNTIENTVEPPVDGKMSVIFEDDEIFVINKSAPLPVHPCGRFNKNTAIKILERAFPDLALRPVHRLDADTTGVLLMAKSREAARALAQQFERQVVEKRYLALVEGHPRTLRFSCALPIEASTSTAGTRQISDDGRAALTEVTVIELRADGRALLAVKPHGGRTNQIRIHLAELGFPIVGDRAYGKDRDLSDGFSQGAPVCLHAQRLSLGHPRGHPLDLEAPAPAWASI